ncbi:hypothetical protein Bpla01_65050 [Burkholderia plantarii]|nr:hypothetical protein Bpla01_65050 [Burkholderia plantarii]
MKRGEFAHRPDGGRTRRARRRECAAADAKRAGAVRRSGPNEGHGKGEKTAEKKPKRSGKEC